jgi:tetratricopeptide (TPR) repeat protein
MPFIPANQPPRCIRAIVSSLCLCLPAVPALAQPPQPASQLDITTYGVVLQEPAMARASVRRGLRAGEVLFEVTTPHVPRAGERFPAVVFVNGVGADFRAWKIYTDWARLVAARGMAGVVYQGSPTDPAASLEALIAHLRALGAELGIEGERLALWACSANVTTALPYLMGTPPSAVRGAVLYYGSTRVPAIRRDLPVFYLLAERDGAPLNEGIRTLWTEAAKIAAPWTMVVASGMPHAFDALVETRTARDLVERTLEFLSRTLAPPAPPGPAPSLARQALIASYGVDWPAAAAAYGVLAKDHPRDGDAVRGLALALLRSGRGAEAIEPLRQALALGVERPDLHDLLGGALLVRGENAEAAAELEKALAGGLAGFRRGVALYNLACAYARLGRVDDALARLESAIGAGFATRQEIEHDPDLEPLRADPRFAALLARLPPP